MYPGIQKKAQAELDMMIGKNRLPTFDDRPFLPYVEAVVKECFRWHTVVPLGLSPNVQVAVCEFLNILGVAHRVDEDDEYNGYFIPAGTTVIGNTWCVNFRPME